MSINITLKEDLIQEQILLAAKRLFGIHGLAKVTMDDVAKAIGKGRSSLYYYYKSKDEIFDAVVNIEIKDMLETMKKATEQVITVEEKINALFIAKIKMGREKGSFFSTIEAGMDADAVADFSKTKNAHHDMIMKQEAVLLRQILNNGVINNELKPIEKNNLDTLIFVLLSSLHGLKREMRMENNTRDIEPAIGQFTQTIMHGLMR